MNNVLRVCATALILSSSGAVYAHMTLNNAIYAQDWAGAYVGASGGYSQTKDFGTGHNKGLSTPNSWTHNSHLNDVSLGFFGGYNWIINNNLLVGLETEYLHRKSHSGRTSKYSTSAIGTDYSAKTKIKGVASIRARIGGFFNQQQTLAYVTLGQSNAKVERIWIDSLGTDTKSQKGWHNGWTAGIGLEHKYFEKLSIRAEIRHSNYGEELITMDLWDKFYKKNLTENSAVIGLAYSF